MNMDTLAPLDLFLIEAENQRITNDLRYRASKSLVVQKQLRR